MLATVRELALDHANKINKNKIMTCSETSTTTSPPTLLPVQNSVQTAAQTAVQNSVHSSIQNQGQNQVQNQIQNQVQIQNHAKTHIHAESQALALHMFATSDDYIKIGYDTTKADQDGEIKQSQIINQWL